MINSMNPRSNQSDAKYSTDAKATSISHDAKLNRQHYSCHICQIDLSNSKNYASHLNSREHQITQIIHDVLQSIPSEFRSAYKSILTPDFFLKKIFNRRLKFENEKNFLGLNSIIEFQFENLSDPVQYVCETCRCKCSSTSSIYSHLSSIEHQRKFFVSNSNSQNLRHSSSTIRSDENQNQNQIQFHLQLNRFLGPKSIVLALKYRSSTLPIVQLAPKAFEDYDFPYANPTIDVDQDEIRSDSLQQRGLSSEDLFFPFNRDFWHENYSDLLQSRPVDPHWLTYEEPIIESQRISTVSRSSNIEKDEKFQRNSSQTSSTRRVILDSSRSSNGSKNLIITTTNNDSSPIDFENEMKINGTSPILNEHSARAILAASGLLKFDDEEEEKRSKPSNQSVSPALAKRMLDAVLTGELDVVHLQPYFSTFVNLIQTGQVELERNQAERLLHKLLVGRSTSTSPRGNSLKRIRSDNYSQSQGERRVSSTSMSRRVHLIDEPKSNHVERSFHFSNNFQR